MNNRIRAKNKNQNSGITLIALVVTIVVLIILATVSINAVFSENGIIKKAELAKSMHANAIKSDEESMNTLLEEYANAMAEPAEDIQAPTISILGDTLTIVAVANATSYDVYVDGILKINTIATTVDLTTFNLEVGNYEITVKAKAEGLNDSAISGSVSYTVASTEDELAGTWVFKDNISTVSSISNISVDYILPDVDGFKDPQAESTQIYFNVDSLDFYFAAGSATFVPSKNVEVYSNGSWKDTAYKTIIIRSKLSEIENGAEFLVWIRANATKQ